MFKSKCIPLFVLILLGMVFQNCKKDKTSSQILTSGYWKVTAIDYDNITTGGAVTDPNSKLMVYAECHGDDEISFKSNGEWTFGGANQCFFDDAYNNVGAWSLSPDEKTLNLENGDYFASWEILSLTKNTLKVKYSGDISGGSQYAVYFDATFTYTNQ